MKIKRQNKMLILILLLLLLTIAADSRLKTVYYEITSPKLTAPVRIALLTDLHSCSWGENQSQLLAALNAQKPDFVLLGGDIFDDKLLNDNVEYLLQGLAPYPCFYVTGNHEYRRQDLEEVLALLRRYNVQILQGDCQTVQAANGQQINICGVDDPSVRKYSLGETSTEQQLAELGQADANGLYTLLLAHRPERIQQYLWYGFDLVLCGHAHGGQWRLPGLINGLFAPNQGLFPKYAGGLYDFGASQMIVSRGLEHGKIKIPRLFNRPELVIIDIRP